MKILVCHNYLSKYSGIPDFIVAEANILASQNNQVYIYTHANKRDDLNINVKVLYPFFIKKGFGYIAKKIPFLDYIYLFFIILFIRPDIVEVHFQPFDKIVSKLKKLFNNSFIFSYRYYSVTYPYMYSNNDKLWRDDYESELDSIFENSDVIVPISEFVAKKRTPQRFDTKVNTVLGCLGSNIIEQKDLVSLEAREDLVFIGRLNYHKGIHFLIKIYDELVKQYPNIKINIIGRYDLNEYYESLKNDIESRKGLVLHGVLNTKDKNDILKNSKILIFPSLYEGQGAAPLEAASYGIPSVGFNVCSVPEVILDKKTGLLSDGEDYKNMADNIIKLYEDKKLYEDISNNCLSFVKNHTWEKAVKQKVKIWENKLHE